MKRPPANLGVDQVTPRQKHAEEPKPTREAAVAAEHRTAGRVMSILELVLATEPDGIRLVDLASELGAPKSSVHALAKGLVAAGYLREESGRYFAGPAFSNFLTIGRIALPSVYRHALEALAAQWNETAILITLVGDTIVYLECAESEAFIRAAPRMGKRLPLWPRSSGKCFLAFMPPARLNAYISRHRAELPPMNEFLAELGRVRESRVAVNDASVAGYIGIASPIVTRGEAVTLALSLGGPKPRMQERLDEMAESLRHAALSLSSPLDQMEDAPAQAKE